MERFNLSLACLEAQAIYKHVLMSCYSASQLRSLCKQPDFLLALEATYAGRLRPDDDEAYHNGRNVAVAEL